MDIASLIGVLVGFGAILGGNIMEGGHTESLMQLTAGIIVLGGTAGSVFVSNTMADIKLGMKFAVKCFVDKSANIDADIEEVLACAQIAKKESILALEKKLATVNNEFFKEAISAVIDGIDPATVRDICETKMQQEEDIFNAGAKVWTDAGGFAPTIGIIGAVLGLIHVMNNLSDPSKLGPGIAVAFVATVYGVASANLLFLPMGNKIKKKGHHRMNELMPLLDGALMIGAGMNPKVIERKLMIYKGGH